MKSRPENFGLNLVVIRARDARGLARFYSLLGLEFAEEKHGAGPAHFACDLGGFLFEIYPRSDSQPDTSATRVGFQVSSLSASMKAMALTGTRVLRQPESTKWGRRAVIVDPEGHRVELLERTIASLA